MGALSNALQRVLCQVGARLPFNVLLWQAPEPPAGSRHHASPRPRRQPHAPQYWLQRGPPRSGIGLPLVPLDPKRLRVPTLQLCWKCSRFVAEEKSPSQPGCPEIYEHVGSTLLKVPLGHREKEPGESAHLVVPSGRSMLRGAPPEHLQPSTLACSPLQPGWVAL
ncbi:hypothetical protein NDU88_002341 [Pleurodeles waltl]|uniref:Uncharacterized protein n=1 Tax=Pleurodeles waltl TaxID=8319 RepID=A0AAV7R9Q8_PLEWA|nr:hypothetical protein NDU88_002341 [Pleurodeles waltl]